MNIKRETRKMRGRENKHIFNLNKKKKYTVNENTILDLGVFRKREFLRIITYTVVEVNKKTSLLCGRSKHNVEGRK